MSSLLLEVALDKTQMIPAFRAAQKFSPWSAIGNFKLFNSTINNRTWCENLVVKRVEVASSLLQALGSIRTLREPSYCQSPMGWLAGHGVPWRSRVCSSARETCFEGFFSCLLGMRPEARECSQAPVFSLCSCLTALGMSRSLSQIDARSLSAQGSYKRIPCLGCYGVP